MSMTREEFAEIVTRRFRIERGPEGEVERIYVEGDNAKGRPHWFLVWAGEQAGGQRGLSWLDVNRLLWIDLVVPPLDGVPPQALGPRKAKGLHKPRRLPA
jgi:hypothetical protein